VSVWAAWLCDWMRACARGVWVCVGGMHGGDGANRVVLGKDGLGWMR
jgi:hypothetical protein